VIYQLSVPAFGGDFDGVRARLPYLGELGVDVLWIMPIHPIGACGDPYAVRDFDAIEPGLGDAASLRALVDAAHARGVRVILDWTLNRNSIDHPFTRTHPHWYTRRADGSIYYAVPNRAEFAGFDFTDRALRRTLIDSMCGWITRFCIDGLRFDDADITPCDFPDEIRAALSARGVAHALAGRQGTRTRVGLPWPRRPRAAWLADRRRKKIGRHEDALKVISRVSKSRPCWWPPRHRTSHHVNAARHGPPIIYSPFVIRF
jgi:hypothetical protein